MAVCESQQRFGPLYLRIDDSWHLHQVVAAGISIGLAYTERDPDTSESQTVTRMMLTWTPSMQRKLNWIGHRADYLLLNRCRDPPACSGGRGVANVSGSGAYRWFY